MSVKTVTIAGVSPSPEVYVDLARAKAVIGAKYGSPAAKWRGMTDDDQGRTLVDATQYVDSYGWKGAALGVVGVDATTLQFPRIGADITDTPTVQLAYVEAAVCNMAVAFASGFDPTALDQGSNIRKLDADGTSIEFFSPTSAADGTAARYPIAMNVLIARYLAVAVVAVVASGFSSGTCGESSFEDRDGMDRTQPF